MPSYHENKPRYRPAWVRLGPAAAQLLDIRPPLGATKGPDGPGWGPQGGGLERPNPCMCRTYGAGPDFTKHRACAAKRPSGGVRGMHVANLRRRDRSRDPIRRAHLEGDWLLSPFWRFMVPLVGPLPGYVRLFSPVLARFDATISAVFRQHGRQGCVIYPFFPPVGLDVTRLDARDARDYRVKSASRPIWFHSSLLGSCFLSYFV